MLLKYLSLIISREKCGSVLRCCSQCLRLFYQVKELISCRYSIQGLWETSKENLLEIYRSFRATSEKLALENYVLAYHTADKDHADIL